MRRTSTLTAGLVLLAVAQVFASADVHASATPIRIPPQGDTQAPSQLDAAMKLIAEKNWPEAFAALRSIIVSPDFARLPRDVQYRTLATAGAIGVQHGEVDLGDGYLKQALAMPQATFDDGLLHLKVAARLGHEPESIAALTALAKRWPEHVKDIDPDFVREVVNEAHGTSPAASSPRLSLLEALYGAHWQFKWEIEPSPYWRDLALGLIDSGRLHEAIDVSSRITDVYVLIAMRADRRFDALVAAEPARFNIDAAADAERRNFEAASEKWPRSLQLRLGVLDALRHQQHYGAMLASADALIQDVESTNFPQKAYEDYDEQHGWLLYDRALALSRLGQTDDAAAQIAAALKVFEIDGGDVGQLIRLADLYCDLDRPSDARAALARSVSETSPYGTMQVAAVRLEAAVYLDDRAQVTELLGVLKAHRSDAPATYGDALVVANQLDLAEKDLIVRLQSPEDRQDALASIQDYAVNALPPRAVQFEARWRTVIARGDVQAAVHKVGRIESYRLEGE